MPCRILGTVRCCSRTSVFAYSIVNNEREHGSYEHFMQRLTTHARNSNQFGGRGAFRDDLPLSSIRSTVDQSALDWNRYTGNSRCHRGVMELDKSTPSQSGKSSQQNVPMKYVIKPQESKNPRCVPISLHSQAKPLAIAAIAALSGITRQTVAKYRHVINETRSNVVVALQPPLTTSTPAVPKTPGRSSQVSKVMCVKHGANQIPAGGVSAPKGRNPTGSLIDPLIVSSDSS